MCVTFIVSTYYAVIIACLFLILILPITGRTGGKTRNHFYLKSIYMLQINRGQFGGLVPEVLIPLALVWIIVLGVDFKGVKKGIEVVVNRIFIPLLVVMSLLS